MYAKRTAAIVTAGQADLAAVGLDCPFDDCEAKTCSSGLARPAPVNPVKPFENVSAMFRRDTWPAVFNFNDGLVIASADPYRDCASHRRVLDRIVDQVD